MAEHTKLPWRVEKGTGLVWGDCTLFEDGTPDRLGVPVTDGQLERPWAQGKGPTYNEMEANAAYIVRACNAFPDLVKALETALGQWGMYADMNEREDERIRLIDERSPEGDLYRHCRKVLNAMKSPGGSDA